MEAEKLLHRSMMLYTKRVRYESFLILLITLIFGCKKHNTTICDDKDELYAYSNYPIGVAIDMEELNFNMRYTEIAIKQFNSITAENAFKAKNLHPSADFFNWTTAEVLSDFCMVNRKRLHGHTLIWGEDLPSWILNYEGSSADWEQLMKKHIQTIVSHFKGKISGWDVVNEAFNEDGTLKNTIWKQKVGVAYIEKAFIYAHEADPDVLLFYNDYNLESNSNKRNSVISYFNNLRNKGVTMDGIGIQMHVNIMSTDAAQIASAIQAISQNNFQIHLSELDISINPLGKNVDPTETLLVRQANLLGAIIQQYKQVPPKQQYGITFWGISDKHSWIRSYFNRKDYPLLYDDAYLPKPAFCKLKDLL